MCGGSFIKCVLIGVEYRNYCQTLDIYLLVAISIGQIESEPIYKLVTYIPFSPLGNFDCTMGSYFNYVST